MSGSRHRHPDVLPEGFLDAGLLGALLEEIDEGLYLVDRDRRILYWSRGAERITGYLAQEVVGRLCQNDLLMHCDAEGNLLCGTGCPLAAVIDDGEPRQADVFLRHHDGHRLPVRVRARALRNAAGEIVGAVELFAAAIAPGRRPEGDGESTHRPRTVPRDFGEWELRHALETLRRFGVPVGWLAIALDDADDWRLRFGPGFLEAAVALSAETVDANLGSHDLLVRWDLTELRVLVENATPAGLAALANKLSILVAASTLDWWGDARQISVSVAAVLATEEDTAETLERRLVASLERRRRRTQALPDSGELYDATRLKPKQSR